MRLVRSHRTTAFHVHCVIDNRFGGLSSLCDTGPNAVEYDEDRWEGEASEVTCPACQKRIKRRGLT